MNNLRFLGQYFDAETGLHYNYFRDYDPSIGRYIESDPIGLEGGLNSYLYAAATPLRFTDPTGQAIPAVIAGCAANPACVALAGATVVAFGNAISGTLSAISGDDSNIIPFPEPTSGTDEQCPADDGDEDDGCTFWYKSLLQIYQGILQGTEDSDDLTKQAYNNSARKYNQICGAMGYPKLPLFSF